MAHVYIGPELDQIIQEVTPLHILVLSQTEHTILTEEPVQSRITGMLLVRILVKEPALPRLSLS